MNNSNSSALVEKTIQAAVGVPDPSPQFLSNLGDQLEARARTRLQETEQKRTTAIRRTGLFKRPHWQLAFAFLLMLVLAVLALGPQNVLAEVQRLVGYIPGVGFYDRKHARILNSPVEVYREGVTLKVEQLLAEPGRTLMVISSEGLPKSNYVYTPSIFPKFTLRLPDGSELESVWEKLHYGGANIEFNGIPQDIYQIIFEVDLLPMVPPGTAPEFWQVPLLLRPATIDPPVKNYLSLYEPTGAIVEENEVIMHILQVAHSSEETSLQVKFEWENHDWELSETYYHGELRDDLGTIYRSYNLDSLSKASLVIGGSPEMWEEMRKKRISPCIETYQFPPLDQHTTEAIFSLPKLSFFVPSIDSFTFDPGPDPQLNQKWALDEVFKIAGIPLYLTEAHLIENTQSSPGTFLYRFEFTFQTPTDLPRTISSILLTNDGAETHSARTIQEAPGVFKASVDYPQIPEAPQTIGFSRTWITLEGPWEIAFSIR